MEIKRRTQEERSAATREALITGARKLWGLRGYAEVGTPEIATEAGVTRRCTTNSPIKQHYSAMWWRSWSKT